ncbi:phage tail protein [Nocardia pseudovaccinii]|uniref:phage tail protein n=1 Tax=Nocardia pseudovaccinii TaxID=189540 RepID=UPI003D8EC9E3
MPEPARKSKLPRPPHNPATPVRAVGAANAMQRLQATAGNGAVAALFAQRLSAGEGASACLPPTVAPTPMTPKQDPKFAAATDQVAAESAAAKAHPAPAKEVEAARDAAVAPADDKDAQAKAAHTATMAAAKPAGFDKAGFIAAVNAAIAAKAPKNLDEADKFATSGKADQVKNEVLGKVGAGKEASAKNIADTTKATPDTSVAKDKPVTTIPAAPPARQPVAPDPAAAVPKPAPTEQVQLGAGSCETNAKMAEAGVTDEQLAKSNEPEFTGALDAKKELQAHDAAAPAQFRQQEAATLAAAKDQAGASAKTGLAAMGSAKSAALQATGAGKDAAKAKDEAERARITGEIKKFFDATKTEVEQILTGLDGLVAQKFEEGERKAKEAFTADHKERMWQYKLRRYGGPLGPTLWVKDLLLDMPAEANNLFLESKKLYESKMSAVISDIADTVGTELNRAKERIAQGRTQVQKFVADQPANLRKLAGQAVDEIGSQFSDLEKSVDEKQQSLVDDLATRYSEARDGIDEEIKKLQDENKGLVGKTIDAVGGAIETIKKLKDMLLGVLARAAGAVEKIIKDPIAFLGNFVNAVKAGISNFMSNIGTHLKKGLQGWLFGALAEAGIEIPAKFDLKGIITLLLSLLGLTWNSIRARIVKVVGEPAMQKIEGAVDFVKAIVTEGIPGLWKWIAQKITDLKEQVMGQIREFVISKVITAGITWLISLLNPAAAFVKACKMIYDAVMWFVDNAERLEEFVDSVLDSVESIASGGVGKVAALIEGTLAKTVPMLISGLASLLGLGGIADKIKKILETVQKPVGQVVDKLIGVAVKYGKKFVGKLKNSKLGKAAGRAADKVKAKLRGGDDSPEGKQKRLESGLATGVSIANRFSGKTVGESVLRPLLSAVRLRYGLQVVEPVQQGDHWAVHAEVQRATQVTAAKAGKGIQWDKPPATKLQARGLDRAEITHVFDQAPNVNLIKSAIMEGMLARAKARTHPSKPGKPAQDAKGRPQPEFIAGRRLSMGGRSLTDGILATLGMENDRRVVRIHKIYEAKSSERQKYKLAEEHDRYSRMSTTPQGEHQMSDKDFLRKEVIENLIAQHYPGEPYETAQAKVTTRFKSRLESLMAAKYREATTGQAVRNRERFSPDVDMKTGSDIPAVVTIDEKSYTVVAFSPHQIVTVGVLPSDVKPGDTVPARLAEQGVKAEFENVAITADALSKLASDVKAAAGK